MTSFQRNYVTMLCGCVVVRNTRRSGHVNNTHISINLLSVGHCIKIKYTYVNYDICIMYGMKSSISPISYPQILFMYFIIFIHVHR